MKLQPPPQRAVEVNPAHRLEESNNNKGAEFRSVNGRGERGMSDWSGHGRKRRESAGLRVDPEARQEGTKGALLCVLPVGPGGGKVAGSGSLGQESEDCGSCRGASQLEAALETSSDFSAVASFV